MPAQRERRHNVSRLHRHNLWCVWNEFERWVSRWCVFAGGINFYEKLWMNTRYDDRDKRHTHPTQATPTSNQTHDIKLSTSHQWKHDAKIYYCCWLSLVSIHMYMCIILILIQYRKLYYTTAYSLLSVWCTIVNNHAFELFSWFQFFVCSDLGIRWRWCCCWWWFTVWSSFSVDASAAALTQVQCVFNGPGVQCCVLLLLLFVVRCGFVCLVGA